MRHILMTTALALTLATAANAQVAASGSTALDTSVGTTSTTKVNRMGDGTTTITRPNVNATTGISSSTTVNSPDARTNNPVDVNADADARTNSRISPAAGSTTTRVHDRATGITRSVTKTTDGAMGSVTDTIKGPLNSGATVNSTTTGSIND